MKAFLYSKYTKFLAVLLFMAALTLGLLAGISGGEKLYAEDRFLYDFGQSFESSYYISYLLQAPEEAVFGAYWELAEREAENNPGMETPTDFYGEEGPQETESMPGEEIPTSFYEEESLDSKPVTEPFPGVHTQVQAEREAKLEKRIREQLENIYESERIQYYVNWNGKIFTNCQGTSPDSLREQEHWRYIVLDQNGLADGGTTQGQLILPWHYTYVEKQPNLQSLTICTSIEPQYALQCAQAWDRQEKLLYNTVGQVLGCVLFAVLMLIYLICVCGRDPFGQQRESWVDHIWAEVHLAAMAGFGIGGTLLEGWIIDRAFAEQFPMDLPYLCGAVLMPLVSGMILCSLLALLRNVKNRCFVRRSFLFLVLTKVFALLGRLWKGLCKGCSRIVELLSGVVGKTYTAFQIALLLGYTVVLVFLLILALDANAEGFLLLLPIFFIGAALLIARRGMDVNAIKTGAAKIRRGELSHKIPELKSRDLQGLREDINDIAQGLNESVSAKVKAERMKTELITNVSHDLKTPLTSIISYTELLSKVEGLPQEAADYIQIIAGKSDRLKRLTQDLFDISKAQSGNEELLLEKLDAQLLIQQALGELDGEIRESGLCFCVKTQPELFIRADGRKMSRVLGNLIHNALKYSMQNTRVFVSAIEEEGQVLLECKNIASYPMDFTGEEITGRFVRGDSARSTEGSGLGLAIAKSYTELCGGDFRVIVDGDLFKVCLRFPSFTES